MDLTPDAEPYTGTLWNRFGLRRLYVTEGETSIGWVDLKTGALELTSDTPAARVEVFIRFWAASEGIQWPPVNPEGADTNPAVAPAQDESAKAESLVEDGAAARDVLESAAAPEGQDSLQGVDLALNKAGEAAQAIADELIVGVSRFRRFLHALFNVHTDARAWAKGAEGERMVASQLARLGPEWRIIRAVNVGARGSDIDHVLIGPAGVITVNAKNHSGAKVWTGGNAFMVNGNKQPYVRNSRHEADRAAKLLTAACGFAVPTTALISIVGSPSDITIKSQPENGVRVAHYKGAKHWIESMPAILTPEQVGSIYAAARISTTWT